jgi:hypothetical protein
MASIATCSPFSHSLTEGFGWKMKSPAWMALRPVSQRGAEGASAERNRQNKIPQAS